MAGDFEVLITADEAWPAFERAVLAARKHVVAGFRIFDLSTGLRSAEARAAMSESGCFQISAMALATAHSPPTPIATRNRSTTMCHGSCEKALRQVKSE